MRRAIAAVLLLFTSPASAGDWQVNYQASKLGFSVPWGPEPYTAVFKNWNAVIIFDPNDLPHAHVLVNIAAKSESSGDEDTDLSVIGDSGFAADKFPLAKFESKTFTSAGNGYIADGTLTIRGISRPLRLPFALAFSRGSAHMTANTQVRWTDFGMGKGMGTELPNIGPLVTIRIDLLATKSKSR